MQATLFRRRKENFTTCCKYSTELP